MKSSLETTMQQRQHPKTRLKAMPSFSAVVERRSHDGGRLRRVEGLLCVDAVCVSELRVDIDGEGCVESMHYDFSAVDQAVMRATGARDMEEVFDETTEAVWGAVMASLHASAYAAAGLTESQGTLGPLRELMRS